MQNYEKDKKKEPRFADPIIKLIDMKGNTACDIRYGRSPSISPDNKSIVFARQKNPITGKRELAETLASNDIQLFDCEKKRMRTLAKPQSGYLDHPLFFPDGKSVTYTMNEAINGAWGGAVGIGRADLTGKNSILLAKETTPAFTCPAKQPESGMCSKQAKPPSNFLTLVSGPYITDNHIFVTLDTPTPLPADMYVANNYKQSIVDIVQDKQTIFSAGPAGLGELPTISIEPTSDHVAMIFSQYWKPFSLDTKNWLPELGPKNTEKQSLYSPNLKYYLSDEDRGFSLVRTADGQKLFMSAEMYSSYDMAWSKDSKKFAVVAVPIGSSGVAYREELAVYSVP